MEDCCEVRSKNILQRRRVHSRWYSFVLNPRTKRSRNCKMKKISLMFAVESRAYSILYDVRLVGNLLTNPAGSSRKIREDKVFPAALILSTKANGANPPTFKQQPNFSMPSARMTCLPSRR